MMDDLYTSNELPFSATEGWKQMQFLLDEKLPVKTGIQKNSVIRSLVSFVLFSIIFIFSSIKLSDIIVQLNVKIPVTAGESVVAEKRNIVEALRPNKNNTTSFAGFTYPTHDKPAFFTNASVSAGVRSIEKINGEFEINAFTEREKVMVLPTFTKLDDKITGERIKVKEKNRSPRWGFAAGAGVNAVEGRQQNFQPFPVAEVTYHLNKKFYVASGLSVLAPVGGDISGTIRTVYINDTVNDIKMYKEVAKYSQLKYANIPLLAGVNITDNISLQAGLQLCVLTGKKQRVDLEPYDFQMNISPAVVPPVAGMAAPQQDAIVKPRNINYQFAAGIKYKINKTSFGLMYQQALQSTGIGNTNTNAGKQVFTLNVLYNLK